MYLKISEDYSKRDTLYVIDGECSFKGPIEQDLGRSILYIKDTKEEEEFLRGYQRRGGEVDKERVILFAIKGALELLFVLRKEVKKQARFLRDWNLLFEFSVEVVFT